MCVEGYCQRRLVNKTCVLNGFNFLLARSLSDLRVVAEKKDDSGNVQLVPRRSKCPLVAGCALILVQKKDQP